MLSSLVIVFLPRRKHLLISVHKPLQSIDYSILTGVNQYIQHIVSVMEKIVCNTFPQEDDNNYGVKSHKKYKSELSFLLYLSVKFYLILI